MPPGTGSGRFGAVVTAMVTPFHADGSLDADGAAVLARSLVAHGSEALVVAGSTGEGAVLDDDEAAMLWRAVTDAVSVPVVAATGTADTRHTIERSRLAAQAGAQALLVVTPYYSRPSQAGIDAHFRAVAASTELPVLIYDIPVRTGRKVAHDTLVRLAHEVPSIIGVKDSAGDPSATARLVAEAPQSFEVYCGDDALLLPMLAVGAVGGVSVASHWVGDEIAALVAAFAHGDTAGARTRNAALLASFAFESTDKYPNPMPAKAICRALGLPAGQCRLPLGPAPEELDIDARKLLDSMDSVERIPGPAIG